MKIDHSDHAGINATKEMYTGKSKTDLKILRWGNHGGFVAVSLASCITIRVSIRMAVGVTIRMTVGMTIILSTILSHVHLRLSALVMFGADRG